MKTKTASASEELIERARTHLGYRSRPLRDSYYGKLTGSPNQPWAGSFIQVLLAEMPEAASAYRYAPYHAKTSQALSFYIAHRRLHSGERRAPRPGDLVFFRTDNREGFEQPHIGIVTDVTHWKTARIVRVIEGETATGLKRGPQEADGVYERSRDDWDILGFTRAHRNSIYTTLKNLLRRTP
jgi:hypothetical protein